MREIKFRAWVKNWSERISEDELNKINGMYTVRGLWQSNSSIKYADLESFKEGSVELWGFRSSIRLEDVYLMQYTGLKDKNGVEIYEGDIVENSYINQAKICTVSFKEGSFMVNYKDQIDPINEHFCNENDSCAWLKIIGNIYQNPKLFKE